MVGYKGQKVHLSDVSQEQLTPSVYWKGNFVLALSDDRYWRDMNDPVAEHLHNDQDELVGPQLLHNIVLQVDLQMDAQYITPLDQFIGMEALHIAV